MSTTTAALGRAGAALLLACVGLAGGCGGEPMVKATIVTEPPAAQVKVNGAEVKDQQYTFKLGDGQSYDVTASAPGSYDLAIKVPRDTPTLKDDRVLTLKLAPDLAYAATVPVPDGITGGVLVQADTRLTRDAAWDKVKSILYEHDRELLMVDKENGRLKTDYLIHTYPRANAKPVCLRSAISVNVSQSDPLVYRVKIFSQTAEGPNPASDQWTDYKRVYQGEVDIVNQIRTEIGVK